MRISSEQKGAISVKKHRIIIAILAIFLIGFVGCASSDKTSGQETQFEEKQKEPSIELNNTYKTKFMEELSLTYPDFQISYPDNWEITDGEVDAHRGEVFALTSDNGGKIHFAHFIAPNDGLGSRAVAVIAEVSKVVNSDFVPGMVEEIDYSGLGEFGVMKIKTKE